MVSRYHSTVDYDVYLDIDGVLLANDLNPANYVHDFLLRVTTSHPVYWLTTHCHGDVQPTIRRLRQVLPEQTLNLVMGIKPTSWSTAKTEAINFTRPFLWFDDDLFFEEKRVLLEHKVLDNWIGVDLAKDPDQLKAFVSSFPVPINLVKG